MPTGYVYIYNFQDSQDVQRNSAKWQMFHGLVLRIQISSYMQRAWRTLELHDSLGDVDDRKLLEYKHFVEFI